MKELELGARNGDNEEWPGYGYILKVKFIEYCYKED
jgi:hypothetical protein